MATYLNVEVRLNTRVRLSVLPAVDELNAKCGSDGIRPVLLIESLDGSGKLANRHYSDVYFITYLQVRRASKLR